MGTGRTRSAARIVSGVAAALLLAAATAGGAAASTASLDGSTVTIVGGPESSKITGGGGLFGTMLTDAAGIVAGAGCEQSSPTQVTCGRYATLNADLGDGDDWIGTSLGPGTMGVVHGGPGDDELYGDSGDNELYGDAGNDKVYGDSGDDRVDGGPGIDQIFGDGGYLEPGSDGMDVIGARDGEPDEIQCGYGFDTVTADRLDRIGSECDSVALPAPVAAPDPIRWVRRVGGLASRAHTRSVRVSLRRAAQVRIAVDRRRGGVWTRVGTATRRFAAGVTRYSLRGFPHGTFRLTVAALLSTGAYGPGHAAKVVVRR